MVEDKGAVAHADALKGVDAHADVVSEAVSVPVFTTFLLDLLPDA